MDKWVTDLVVAEYNTLREEILKRIEIRYQLLTITITAFGAILAFGSQLKSAILIFLYPLLAVCSVIIWLSNRYDIEQIRNYIQKSIENKVGKENLNWESQRFLIERQGLEKLLSYGSTGFFLSTELLALIIGIVMLTTFNESKSTVAIVCAVLAVLCFVITLILLFPRKKKEISIDGSTRQKPEESKASID
jgi:hypothetical protein